MAHRDLNFSDQVRLIQLAVGVPVTGQTSNTNARAMTALTGLSGSQMWKMSTAQFLDHVKNNPDFMAKAQQNMANAGPQYQHLVSAFGGGAAAAPVNPANATAANPGIVQPFTQPTVAPVQAAPAQVAPDPDLLYKQALLSIDPTTGVGVNDVTGKDNPDSDPYKDVPVTVLEKAAKENFTTEMLLSYDQMSQDQGGTFTSILQAIMKALGFNIDITGERDAQTIQAVEDAGELLGNRESIYEDVLSLGDETIQVAPNEDGLVIAVDGNVMMFDREAVIASGGDLKKLIEETPGPLEALTAEQQDKIIDAAGVDRETITVPEPKGVEVEAGADGADVEGDTPPEEEATADDNPYMEGSLANAVQEDPNHLLDIGAAALVAGTALGVRRRAGNKDAAAISARDDAAAAQDAAEREQAAREARENARDRAVEDRDRVYARTNDVPPKTRLERAFGVSEARARQLANVEARRAAADAAVERTALDTDGNLVNGTDADRDAINNRRDARVTTASSDAAKAGFFRRQIDRVSSNLRTATETRAVDVETRAQDTAVRRDDHNASAAQQEHDTRIQQTEEEIEDRQRTRDAEPKPKRRKLTLAAIAAVIGGSVLLAPNIGFADTMFDLEGKSPGAAELAMKGDYEGAADILLVALEADKDPNGEYQGIYASLNNASPDETRAYLASLAAQHAGDSEAAHHYYNEAGFGVTAMVGEDAMEAEGIVDTVKHAGIYVGEGLGLDNVVHAIDSEATLDENIVNGGLVLGGAAVDFVAQNAHSLSVWGLEMAGADIPPMEDLVRGAKHDGIVGILDFMWETGSEGAFKNFHRKFGSFLDGNPDLTNAPDSVRDMADLQNQWQAAEAEFEALNSQKGAWYSIHDDGVDREQLEALRMKAADAKELYETHYHAMVNLGDDTQVAAFMENPEGYSEAPVLALNIPTTESVMEEFASRAVDPDALPEVMAFGADVVTAQGFPPVSAVGDENDVAAYEKAWADNPLAMADAVKEALQSVIPYLTDAPSFAEYLEAVNQYYKSDVADFTRPDGEGAAVKAGLQEIGETLGFVNPATTPVLGQDYKAGLNS